MPHNKTENSSKYPQPERAEDIITRQMLIPLFEDLKDLIKSSAKGTETVLRKEIGSLREEVRFTQQALKATKEELREDIQRESASIKTELREDIKRESASIKTELREDIKRESASIKTELREDIQRESASIKTELREDIQRESASIKTELRDDMSAMEQRLASKTDLHDAEQRLSAKIDSQSGRLENHEARISSLEAVRA